MQQLPDNSSNRLQSVLFIEKKMMTTEEKRILRVLRNRRFFFAASTYCTLSAVLIVAWIQGWAKSTKYGEEEVQRYTFIAPIVISFCFVMLTIFFSHYFYKTVFP